MTKAVIFETSMGQVTFELYDKHAPKICRHFVRLASRGYYAGGAMWPSGTGRGGTSIYGDRFEDEISPELRFTGAGILAMANSGPNTNGSQFFITLAPTPHLDKKHTIFGRVSAGMQVVQRLGAVATDGDDRPRESIKIMKARVADV
ncbi:putative Peptidylprolyl isomerase [Rhodotorula taiwanensis]|uniref:Peptidyl-prolyl cis-trans isomerase n=1 Tax=Rhodotorula taiwanensis TaxID=741276 RepID=A0A2S5B078_9BASI|nr:putative Peptidylprolyl isomerase [Rhodotorula taiwanensis]